MWGTCLRPVKAEEESDGEAPWRTRAAAAGLMRVHGARAAETMRGLARETRRRGRCIGLLARVVYAVLRQVRARALLGARRVDLLDAFALALAGPCREAAAPLLVMVCRRVTFAEGRVPRRVLRCLRT